MGYGAELGLWQEPVSGLPGPGLRVGRGQATIGGVGSLPTSTVWGLLPKVGKVHRRSPVSELQAVLLRLRPWGPGGGKAL